MRAHRIKLDPSQIETKNAANLHRIQYYRNWLRLIDLDPNKQERRDSQKCVVCFYSQTVSGASTTDRQCAFCNNVITSGNTNVNVLCSGCAGQTGLCRQCGGDMEMKNRRKRIFPKRTADLE